MQAIWQFQDERREWEAERERLEKEAQEASTQREEVEKQLRVLASEVERLRNGQAPPAAVEQTQQQPVNTVDVGVLEAARRVHHEKQLSLMATIDGLRGDLQEEQARSKALDKRAAQAELKCRQGLGEDLDSTTRARPVRRENSDLLDVTSRRAGAALADPQREEVRQLEDETLKLREELNSEKLKVVELKKAAMSRGAAWKEQLGQIAVELKEKEVLQGEITQLRSEKAVLQRDLEESSERESQLRREVESLRRDLDRSMAETVDARAQAAGKTDELQQLSRVMGDQIVAVEQELTASVQKNNQLSELFLRHSIPPLSTLRRCCRQMALELARAGALDEQNADLAEKMAPPLHEAHVHDLQNNLVKVVNVLRFSADVLDAHDTWRQTQGVEKEGMLDSTINVARGWFPSVLA